MAQPLAMGDPSPIKVQLRAPDIMHFFNGIEGRKVCKLCLYVWTFDLSILLFDISVPITTNSKDFSSHTSSVILREHLYSRHHEEYDKALLQHRWNYKSSSEWLLERKARFAVADEVSPDTVNKMAFTTSHTPVTRPAI